MCPLLWAAGNAFPAVAQTPPATLVLAMPVTTYRSIQGPWLVSIYREAFAQLGLRMEVRPLPANRASVMASAGLVDGDLHRGHSYGALHPELVRVEQAHFAAAFAVYSRLPGLRLAPGWDGLSHTRLRVEHVLGSVTSTRELTQRVPVTLLSTVTDAQLGLRKLVLDRADLLVALDQIVDPLLGLEDYRRGGIRKVAVLGQADGYLYLHKQHAALAPRLAQVLARMKRTGRIAQLEKQARLNWVPPQSRAEPPDSDETRG
ncbi:hypothetical protein [Pseudoduganella aquatica]|uniref:Transporter substrate-binding domain-containing protein n=1 Tax=Pseudoduganella aquatica TaxID=2660641 RepID=A0A7X4HH98_9BURK|nr:hypothetical protein [Pseudoduganella aquatica]MYN11189.1 hypothetical protein [Pseudoduganella aquatica]